MKTVNLLAIFVVLLAMTSCGKSPDPAPVNGTTPSTTATSTTTPAAPTAPTAAEIAQNCTDITLITQNGISLALSGIASSNPADAKTAATQIQTIVNGTILPLLTGSGGIPSSVVNTLLKENFVTLPSTATNIVSIAAGILDQYIQAPATDTFLTAAEISYANAFFTAMSNGAGMYLASAPVVAPATAPIKAKPVATKPTTTASTTAAPAKKTVILPRAGGWLNLSEK